MSTPGVLFYLLAQDRVINYAQHVDARVTTVVYFLVLTRRQRKCVVKVAVKSSTEPIALAVVEPLVECHHLKRLSPIVGTQTRHAGSHIRVDGDTWELDPDPFEP